MAKGEWFPKGSRAHSHLQCLFLIPRCACGRGLWTYSRHPNSQPEHIPEDQPLPLSLRAWLLPASRATWHWPVVVCAHSQEMVCQPRLDPHWHHAFCWAHEKPWGLFWLGICNQLGDVPQELPGKERLQAELPAVLRCGFVDHPTALPSHQDPHSSRVFILCAVLL